VSVEECVNALYKAKWYGFFDMSDFDLEEYEKYEVSRNLKFRNCRNCKMFVSLDREVW